jgi:Transmembrane domain of unknown function (DUF3566)
MRAKFGRRNTMATLKRIGPGSALKLGAISYAFVGLVIGIIMACVSLVAGSLTGMGGSGMGMSARALGFGMGVGAVIVAPIVYGIIGGIGAGLGAVVYNLAARWVGGLEVDIS